MAVVWPWTVRRKLCARGLCSCTSAFHCLSSTPSGGTAAAWPPDRCVADHIFFVDHFQPAESRECSRVEWADQGESVLIGHLSAGALRSTNRSAGQPSQSQACALRENPALDRQHVSQFGRNVTNVEREKKFT